MQDERREHRNAHAAASTLILFHCCQVDPFFHRTDRRSAFVVFFHLGNLKGSLTQPCCLSHVHFLTAMTEIVTPPPPPPPPPPSPSDAKASFDFVKPFAFVFEDARWLNKVLIGGLFQL